MIWYWLNLKGILKDFELSTADNPSDEEIHNELLKNRYSFDKYKELDGWKRKYWKKMMK